MYLIKSPMETTLHQQLKIEFCDPGAEIEVKLGDYRIDVVCGKRLIEIQRSSLSSISNKIGKLLADGYLVDVVKPLPARVRLVKLDKKNGKEVYRRWSPKRGTIMDLFDELIYFTRVFPHPNLTLIVPMVQIEEVRYPGRGRRRRRRKGDFMIQDRSVVKLEEACFFRNVLDLQKLLPRRLPKVFGTKDLAEHMKIPRHTAQKIAYVLRKTGAVVEADKRGNAIFCRLTTKAESKASLKNKLPKKRPSFKFMEAHLERKAEKERKLERKAVRDSEKLIAKKKTKKKVTGKTKKTKQVVKKKASSIKPNGKSVPRMTEKKKKSLLEAFRS